MAKLLIFGCGFTGKFIARDWQGEVTAVTRANFDALNALGISTIAFDHSQEVHAAIAEASVIIFAAPPPDLAFEKYHREIAATTAWKAYLSTTAVYGDQDGAWVDEVTAPAPTSPRGILRLATEMSWQKSSSDINIFRLSGIYGPGRNPLEKIKSGRTRKIIKQGQMFGRIHVEDIARVVRASFHANDRGEVYNLTDDLPASPQEVLDYASALLSLPKLPPVNFEDAKMTDMARSFYSENKRVSNAKIRERFGAMIYPTYKEGLDALC